MSDETGCGYSNKLDPEQQVAMEERIAAEVFDYYQTQLDEETCAQIGRDVLFMVLREFRPDLFIDQEKL